MTTIQLRTAVGADRPELQRVFEAASLSNVDDAPLLRAHPEYLVFPGDGIADGRTRVAVGGPPDDERLLGFATVLVDNAGELDLEDLFVDPDWHRNGIASALIADAVDAARAAGYERLWVTANPHALGFYRAVGFVEIGQMQTALGSGPRMCLDV
jgi:GNAT superfamily N-acetyltransferase